MTHDPLTANWKFLGRIHPRHVLSETEKTYQNTASIETHVNKGEIGRGSPGGIWFVQRWMPPLGQDSNGWNQVLRPNSKLRVRWLSQGVAVFFNISQNEKRWATQQLGQKHREARNLQLFSPLPHPQVAGLRRCAMVLVSSARAAKAARDLCGAARRSSRCSCMSQSLLAAPFAESLREAEELLKINFFHLAAHYSSCSSTCTWLVCIGTPWKPVASLPPRMGWPATSPYGCWYCWYCCWCWYSAGM